MIRHQHLALSLSAGDSCSSLSRCVCVHRRPERRRINTTAALFAQEIPSCSCVCESELESNSCILPATPSYWTRFGSKKSIRKGKKTGGGLSEWRRKEWPICLKTRQSKLPSFPLKTKRINQPRDRAGTRKNLCVHSSSVTFDPSSTCKERPRKEREIKKNSISSVCDCLNLQYSGALTMFPRTGANKQRTCRLAVSVDPPPTAVYRFHFAALSLSFYLLFLGKPFFRLRKIRFVYLLPSLIFAFVPFQKVIRYRRHTVDSCCRQQQQQPIYQSPIVVDGRNTRRKLEIATQHKVAGCIRTQYKHGEVGTLYSSRSELWGGWRRKMSVCKEHLAISADTFSNYNRIFGERFCIFGGGDDGISSDSLALDNQ